MKNIITKSFLILGALLAATGCSDDFLQSDIPGKLSSEEFFKTDADALQATTAVYDMMQSGRAFGWSSIYMIKMMPSDESNASGDGPGDITGYQTLDDFNFDSENEEILGAWKTAYYAINRANQVINKVLPENDLRNRLIAEAKTLRAYNYFELVSLWGDVPLVLNDLKPDEFTTQKRAGKSDIYAQIEKDLTEVIQVLPNKSEYGSADKFRVSKQTAQAILGKAYLYQEKWTDAAAEFAKIIVSGNCGLEEDFATVFSKSGEFGNESLFELSYAIQPNSGGGRGQEDNLYIHLMGPNSEYYVQAPGDSLVGGWGFNVPTAKLFDAFVNAGDLVRRKYTIMSEAELNAKGGDWTADGYYDYEGFFNRKYGSFTSERHSEDNTSYGTNWRLIRYADVLLMAAEAYYRMGDEPSARTELNKVRERAELIDINATGNDLFEAIVKERQLELAYEGFRYIDLVRWGRAEQELGSRGFIAGKHELLPIPNNDVRSGGLSQNPNY